MPENNSPVNNLTDTNHSESSVLAAANRGTFFASVPYGIMMTTLAMTTNVLEDNPNLMLGLIIGGIFFFPLARAAEAYYFSNTPATFFNNTNQTERTQIDETASLRAGSNV